MSGNKAPFAQTTLENARRGAATTGIERSLSVAVLGPAVDDSPGSGGWKRQQIYDTLVELGHRPFFPEERVERDSLWVDREIQILSASDVNLVIVLQTADSIGVMGELPAFVREASIVSKTAVLTPVQHYKPTESFLANAVSYYRVRVPYAQQHFDECRLLNDCREIVSDFLSGNSPLVLAPEF